jgi:hypothetical protein
LADDSNGEPVSMSIASASRRRAASQSGAGACCTSLSSAPYAVASAACCSAGTVAGTWPSSSGARWRPGSNTHDSSTRRSVLARSA